MRRYPSEFQRDAYTDAYLLAHVTEDQVQAAIMGLLRAKRIAAAEVDAGGKHIRGGFIRAARAAGLTTAGALVARGRGAACAGLPDIIGCLPGGRAFYCEVKAPGWYRIGRGNALRVVRCAGEPSVDQLAFLDTMAKAGALCLVAWSSVDVEDALREAGL